MKIVLQRVLKAKVIINEEIYSSINQGILLLVGIEEEDTGFDYEYYVNMLFIVNRGK